MIDRDTDSGFTLLELLVALSLFGLLSLALSGNLTLGTSVWKTTITHTKEMQKFVSFDEAIQSELKHLYPRSKIARSQARIIDFDGNSHRIEFLTEYPLGSGKISRVIYQLSPRGGVESLARHELANSLDQSQFMVVGGIRAMSFEYYGSLEPSTPSGWHDAWQEMPIAPALIKIRAVSSDAKLIQLIVAPLLSTDSSCNYDLLTRKCRVAQ